MNHRERLLAAVRHQKVDRLPTFFDGTPEIQERLLRHFGIDAAGMDAHATRAAVLDALDIDGTLWLGPCYEGPPTRKADNYAEDEWQFGYKRQGYGAGSYDEQVYFPLADAETVADIEAYRWPDLDCDDFSVLPEMARHCAGRAIDCGYTGIFKPPAPAATPPPHAVGQAESGSPSVHQPTLLIPPHRQVPLEFP